MENDNLNSKKMNNKQVNDNDLSFNNHQEPQIKSEIETDNQGNQTIVQRTRNVEGGENLNETKTNPEKVATPSEATEELGKIMVENKDKNSDITKNRYPNADADNHENRGNF